LTLKVEVFIDRSGWPAGPWGDEPDRVEWRDGRTGLTCLVLRHRKFGSWCAYVAVPPGHPLHGRDYGDADVLDIYAHGGLTFAGPCMDDDRPKVEQVCHVPEPGEPDDVWWFGFDCNHAGDYAPGMVAAGIEPWRDDVVYRDLGYVQGQCELLAWHLAAARSAGTGDA
jgi:hypothetical protein